MEIMKEDPAEDPAVVEITNWEEQIAYYRAIYLYPYKGVTYKSLAQQSFLDHAAISSGIAAGRPTTLYCGLASVLTKLFCFSVDASYIGAKSTDEDVKQQKVGEILRQGLCVSVVSTAVAELFANIGLTRLTETFVDYMCRACHAGAHHCHVLEMTCEQFYNVCQSGAVGALSAIFSFVMTSAIQFLKKEKVTIADNLVSSLMLGCTAALATLVFHKLVAVCVSSVVAQGLSYLRLRAKHSNQSLGYHVLCVVTYVSNCDLYQLIAEFHRQGIAQIPRTFYEWFIPMPTNVRYDTDAADPIPDSMACGICSDLMYDACRLNGHCYCRACVQQWVFQLGEDRFHRPATEDDIIPAAEVDRIIRFYANSQGIRLVEV